MIEEWLKTHDPQYSRIIIAASTHERAQYVRDRLPQSTHKLIMSTNGNFQQALMGLHNEHVLLIRHNWFELTEAHRMSLDYISCDPTIDVW